MGGGERERSKARERQRGNKVYMLPEAFVAGNISRFTAGKSAAKCVGDLKSLKCVSISENRFALLKIVTRYRSDSFVR